MLSNKEIVCPNNLLDVTQKKRGVKAAIVNAGKLLPMLSIQDAVNENLIEPVFIGDEKEIQKCAEDLTFEISKYEIIDEPGENKFKRFKMNSKKDIKISKTIKKDLKILQN